MAPALRLITRHYRHRHVFRSSISLDQTFRCRSSIASIAQRRSASVSADGSLHSIRSKSSLATNLNRARDSHAVVSTISPILSSTSSIVSSRIIQQQSRSIHTSSNLRASPKPIQGGKPDSPSDTPPKPSDPSSLVGDLTSADPKSTGKIVPNLLSKITTTPSHENIYTLPNFLTTTRIITAPIISYALLHSQPVLAMGLFAYSSITDLVDGYLARRYNSGTVLGSILDPFADKLLMTLTTITLYSIGTFPWWLTLIILGRDGGLALSALYFRWISLPPPRTMTRYWDFSLPSAEVRPTEISKINTMLQFLLVANALLLPTLPTAFVEAWNLYGVFEGWMALVAGTTVWSGASYLFTKDAIRFIGRDR